MGKMVFFDVDGTLLNSRNEVPPATVDAILRLKEKDVKVAIATGRAPFMFKFIREPLGIDTFVSLNGQYVVVDGRPIFQFKMDPRHIERLLEKGKEKGHPFVFMSHDRMCATMNGHSYIKESMRSINVPEPGYDPEFYKKGPVYQMLLFCEPGEEKEYEAEFPMFRFLRWHRYALDVMPKGGSKAEGIRRISEYCRISKSDIFAFGDGMNDIEMLHFAGKGIAMGNAPDIVKRYADYVTKHVDEDGVYHGLIAAGLL